MSRLRILINGRPWLIGRENALAGRLAPGASVFASPCFRLIGILTLIRLEQVRAELRQCRQMYSLARMPDLTCVQQVVENLSETAQLPEIGVVKFHVGLPVFSVSPEEPLSDPVEVLDAVTWEDA
jgi:hypothetical protein